jgi:hypothetical protein
VDDASFMGYKALCPFAPLSSLILIAAGVFFIYFCRKARSKA